MEEASIRLKRGRISKKALEIIGREGGDVGKWLSNTSRAIQELGGAHLDEVYDDAIFLIPRYMYSPKRHYRTINAALKRLIYHLKSVSYLVVKDTGEICVVIRESVGLKKVEDWFIKNESVSIDDAMRTFPHLKRETLRRYLCRLGMRQNGVYIIQNSATNLRKDKNE